MWREDCPDSGEELVRPYAWIKKRANPTESVVSVVFSLHPDFDRGMAGSIPPGKN